MKKIAFALICLSLGFSIVNPGFNLTKVNAFNDGYDSSFVYEEKSSGTYKITGITDTSLTNLRVYGESSDNKIVDEIDHNAFTSLSNLDSIMISKDIDLIYSDSLDFSNLDYLYYTGSIGEWNSNNIQSSAVIYDYAFDEGFINYWNLYVRPTKDESICNIGEAKYKELLNRYNALPTEDYHRVNEYEDLAGETIEESMEYLDEFFNPKEKPKSEELPKDLTLILIICISVFGMSMIAIFYLLKKKDIIH